MEEIVTESHEDLDSGYGNNFITGMAFGTVFTVACYYVGRGIGTVYCNIRDRHDLKKIAKNMPPK